MASGPGSISGLRIELAAGTDDLAWARRLFRDYADGLGIDLGFQGFEAELAGLPGRYAPPGGAILLAWDDRAEPLGCVALRPLDRPLVCEMKRLYVRPEGRGRGLGRALAVAVLERAGAVGYGEMRLDTLPSMARAQDLYRSLGFRPIPPYGPTGDQELLFLGRAL